MGLIPLLFLGEHPFMVMGKHIEIHRVQGTEGSSAVAMSNVELSAALY